MLNLFCFQLSIGFDTPLMIWKNKPTVAQFNQVPVRNLSHALGIEITEVGDDYLKGKMPVDERTIQPYGLLHGGASCALAESLGSAAGSYCVDLTQQAVVGLEINANHVRSVKSGFVYGTAKPLHLGGTTQIWEIQITNEEGKLVCISRLTLAVISLKKS